MVTSNFVNEVFGSFQRLYLNVTDGVTVQSCAGDGTTPLNITPAVNNGTACPLSAAAANNREDSLIPVIGSLGFPGVAMGILERRRKFLFGDPEHPDIAF